MATFDDMHLPGMLVSEVECSQRHGKLHFVRFLGQLSQGCSHLGVGHTQVLHVPKGYSRVELLEVLLVRFEADTVGDVLPSLVLLHDGCPSVDGPADQRRNK